ncbi:ubiquitin carboxyl-terminal hydrolase 24 [Selaginella moellendorffii]|uniref:ubiquitin carboxyl-terminal hydrolase 24 n=1 Tax=Selaginella moellendorffii TaxID=88036 RepID=UPI000D1CBCEC|nr:ubiquitin carboxyl-terminal hydrolase 24 [Selaginella moellendorffii]|eukprot:XP_024545477.1 ubiquitin carboxyl-terminal hydrolase 24 [Selaginella moellendorffii]
MENIPLMGEFLILLFEVRKPKPLAVIHCVCSFSRAEAGVSLLLPDSVLTAQARSRPGDSRSASARGFWSFHGAAQDMMDKVILFGSFSEDEALSFQESKSASKPVVKNVSPEKKAPVNTTKTNAGPTKPSNGVKHIAPPPQPQSPKVIAVTPIRNVASQLERTSLNPERQRERDPGASKTVAKSWASLVQPAAITPRGLVNTGNSCYLNSTLQALLSCPPFLQLVLTLKGKTPSPESFPALHGFVSLISEFEKGPSSETRSDLYYRKGESANKDVQTGVALVPSMFDPCLAAFRPNEPRRQEDAPEFLCFLLNQIHEELLKLDGRTVSEVGVAVDDEWETVGPKNRTARVRTCSRIWSPLTDIFCGQLYNNVKPKGSKASIQVEPFYVLTLDISSGTVHSVEDALKDSSRGTKVVSLPKVLILQLLRFGYGNSGTRKVSRAIDFSEQLTVGKELLSPGNEATSRYELIASIMHHGKDVTSGHYTADAKYGDSWLRFDDRMVDKVSVDMVLNKQAYVLFYRKL